jgi:hypothetical protein
MRPRSGWRSILLVSDRVLLGRPPGEDVPQSEAARADCLLTGRAAAPDGYPAVGGTWSAPEVLVYSTCTLCSLENERAIADFWRPSPPSSWSRPPPGFPGSRNGSKGHRARAPIGQTWPGPCVSGRTRRRGRGTLSPCCAGRTLDREQTCDRIKPRKCPSRPPIFSGSSAHST